jgi:hypothetical protein
MFALPPKADMGQHDRDVRFVPIADIGPDSSTPSGRSRSQGAVSDLRRRLPEEH